MKLKLTYLLLFILLVSSAFATREDEYNFARKLFNDKYYDLAAEQYRKFIANYPDDVRVPYAYYMQGASLAAMELWDEARSAYLRLGLEYPDSKYAPEAFYLSADCLKKMNRLTEAARGFLIVSDYYPRSEFAAKGILNAGMIFRGQGDDLKAKEAFEKIIKLYPGTASASIAYFNLAELAEKNGDNMEALWKYQMSLQISESDTLSASAYIRRALIYYRTGDWDLAEDQLKKVESPLIFVRYAVMLEGVWLQKKGDFIGAEQKLKSVARSVKSDTLKAVINLHLGDNCYHKGDYQASLDYYREIPPNDSVYLRMGLTYVELDSLDEAVRCFGEALKCKGPIENKLTALEQLGELYSKGTRTAEVSELLASSVQNLEKMPHWDRFTAGLGLIAFQEGNYDIAQEFFSPILNIKSPWSDDAHYYIARILEAKQDTLECIQSYESFLKKFPGSDFSRDAEKRLENIRFYMPKQNLIEEIAALSSASINYNTKGELALNWAKLYYNGFKDLKKTCDQLQLALNSNELTTKETIESLELLADALLRRSPNEPALQDSLRRVMRRYLQITKTGNTFGEFSLYLLREQVAASGDKKKAVDIYYKGLEEIFTKYNIDRVIPEVLSELVRLCIEERKDYIKGITYGLKLENDYPKSIFNESALQYRSEGKLALFDTTGAIEDLKTYISKYPDGYNIFKVSRRLAEITADNQQKIAMVKPIITRFYYHSGIPELVEYLGDLYMLNGDYKEALKYYTQVSEDYYKAEPLGVESNLHYKLGLGYQRLGDLVKSQDHYLIYAVQNPDGEFWENAIFALAEISESSERAPAALKFYQNLVKRAKEKRLSDTAYRRMAAINYQIGNYSEGIMLYQNLAKNEADIDDRMFFEAQAIIGLYRQDLLDEAKDEAVSFARTYGIYPKLVEYQAAFYLEKGKSQARDKNFKEALNTLDYALKKYPRAPSIPEMEYEIGKIYLITNRFDEALDLLTSMINKYPDHDILPSVYLSLGTFYYRQSQFQNALLAFQKILDNPKGKALWSSAINNLEMTYKDLGLYEAALSMVNRYLEMYPFSEDVLSKKVDAAQILLNLREYDRAIDRLKALLPQVTPEMGVEIQFYVGEAYFRKGDFQQAVLEYMKVKYLDIGGGPDWAVTAIYNAGQCYEKLGQDNEAEKMYREIIERFGKNSDYGQGAQSRIDFLKQK